MEINTHVICPYSYSYHDGCDRIKDITCNTFQLSQSSVYDGRDPENLTLSRTQPRLDPRIILSFDCKNQQQNTAGIHAVSIHYAG